MVLWSVAVWQLTQPALLRSASALGCLRGGLTLLAGTGSPAPMRSVGSARASRPAISSVRLRMAEFMVPVLSRSA